VHFTSSDTKAVLPPDSMLITGSNSLNVILKTVGNQTITATDVAAPSITGSSQTIDTAAKVEIISGLPPNGTAGKPYGPLHTMCCGRGSGSFFQLAANATGTWSWAAAPGSLLPPGVNCCSLTIKAPGFIPPGSSGSTTYYGVISGVPQVGGSYKVVVSFLESGTTNLATATYTIVISPAQAAANATANLASKSEPNSAAQTYTTIDFPGATATTLSAGPNPQGTSVGTYTDGFGVIHGFTLTNKSVFSPVEPPGSTLTTPGFISPQGDIVGVYVDARGVSHGFILSGGKFANIDFPGATGTALSGLNPSGEMSGFICSDPACGLTGAFSISHSFVISKKGVFTSFDPPGAISSNASAVNPSGEVVGAYTDNAGIGHGYIFDHGTFTTIDFPGATFTFIGGGNAEGDVVGEYNDAAGVGHSFLRSKGIFTSFDPPGATFSLATGINPAGIIVGAYFDSVGVEHGYIRTP
jgi:hypothetical protein